MTLRRSIIACGAVVLLEAFLAGIAPGMPFEKRTTFTFSAPFSVPGVTLPAGSYVFRLADEVHGRDIVQVLGAEDGVSYGMFHTLRTRRGRPADKPEIHFLERASDMPIAIRSWWYPTDTQGYEFQYPRE
jgi:hypothetical protein